MKKLVFVMVAMLGMGIASCSNGAKSFESNEDSDSLVVDTLVEDTLAIDTLEVDTTVVDSLEVDTTVAE